MMLIVFVGQFGFVLGILSGRWRLIAHHTFKLAPQRLDRGEFVADLFLQTVNARTQTEFRVGGTGKIVLAGR